MQQGGGILQCRVVLLGICAEAHTCATQGNIGVLAWAPPIKLPAPLALTTSRSNVCKDGPASLVAWRCAHKICDGETVTRGGSRFGQGTVHQLSGQGLILGTLQPVHGGRLWQEGQVCVLAGRLNRQVRVQRGVSLGQEALSAATASSRCLLFSLPLCSLWSSVRFGSVTQGMSSSRTRWERAVAVLVVGWGTCSKLVAYVTSTAAHRLPRGGVWMALGINLSLQVHSSHPPAC